MESSALNGAIAPREEDRALFGIHDESAIWCGPGRLNHRLLFEGAPASFDRAGGKAANCLAVKAAAQNLAVPLTALDRGGLGRAIAAIGAACGVESPPIRPAHLSPSAPKLTH